MWAGCILYLGICLSYCIFESSILQTWSEYSYPDLALGIVYIFAVFCGWITQDSQASAVGELYSTCRNELGGEKYK